MINLENIRTCTFILKKRLDGYRLLQNPKGSPRTEVNMIKSDEYLNRRGVVTSTYSKIQRTVDEFRNSNVFEKWLESERTYNFETNKFSKKRNIILVKNEDYDNPYMRSDFTNKKLDNLPELSMDRLAQISKRVFFKDYNRLRNEDLNWFQRILFLGQAERIGLYREGSGEGFWKILHKNLQG